MLSFRIISETLARRWRLANHPCSTCNIAYSIVQSGNKEHRRGQQGRPLQRLCRSTFINWFSKCFGTDFSEPRSTRGTTSTRSFRIESLEYRKTFWCRDTVSMWMHSSRIGCWQHRLPSRRCELRPEFWKQHNRHWQPLISLSTDWLKRLWKLGLLYWKIVVRFFHVGSPSRFKPCLRCKFRKGHHGSLSLCCMARFVD